jgi:hypothetical protein
LHDCIIDRSYSSMRKEKATAGDVAEDRRTIHRT